MVFDHYVCRHGYNGVGLILLIAVKLDVCTGRGRAGVLPTVCDVRYFILTPHMVSVCVVVVGVCVIGIVP